MTELGVPCFFTYRATTDDHHVYYSRLDMEVWAMIYPADEKLLLSKFSKASKIERVSVPARFPYIFYIFKFVAEVNTKVHSSVSSFGYRSAVSGHQGMRALEF